MGKSRTERINACEEKIKELQKEVMELKTEETKGKKEGLLAVKKVIEDNSAHLDGLYACCSEVDCDGAGCESLECLRLKLNCLIDNA
jgi:hypothetical protein